MWSWSGVGQGESRQISHVAYGSIQSLPVYCSERDNAMNITWHAFRESQGQGSHLGDAAVVQSCLKADPLAAQKRFMLQHCYNAHRNLSTDLWLLGAPSAAISAGGGDTSTFLAALQTGGFSCTEPQEQRPRRVNWRKGTLTLLLADFAGTPGDAVPRPWAPSSSAELHVCSFYCAVRELIRSLEHHGASPCFILNWAQEWGTYSWLLSLQNWLTEFEIPPFRTIALHLNLGPMMPLDFSDLLRDADRKERRRHWQPLQDLAAATTAAARAPGARLGKVPIRVRSSWWSTYYWNYAQDARSDSHLSSHIERHRLCSTQTGGHGDGGSSLQAQIVASRRSWTATTHPPALVLGGQPRTWRGLVMLDLERRNLLHASATRWSAARFEFCEQGCSTCRLALFWKVSPLASLVSNASLVRSLCDKLPRLLDVDPRSKSATDHATSHELWRGTRFSLTFETAFHADDRSLEYLFYTEKALKPLLQLRAIVMLGSPGTLAFLRSLGFASFGSVVDERYDSILGGHARLEAAVAEMERLVKLPPEAWANEALIAALIHNQRWFFCPGGFHDSLATRAVQAVLLAEGMVHRGGGTN